jgi:hypothetical protein
MPPRRYAAAGAASRERAVASAWLRACRSPTPGARLGRAARAPSRRGCASAPDQSRRLGQPGCRFCATARYQFRLSPATSRLPVSSRARQNGGLGSKRGNPALRAETGSIAGHLRVPSGSAAGRRTRLQDVDRRVDDQPHHAAMASASELLRVQAVSAVGIEPTGSILLRPWHRVSVAVEVDRDVGVAHEGREGFGIDPSGNHQRQTCACTRAE